MSDKRLKDTPVKMNINRTETQLYWSTYFNYHLNCYDLHVEYFDRQLFIYSHGDF